MSLNLIPKAPMITACDFHKKKDYTYKNGSDSVDEEQRYRLGKFR